MAKNVMFSTAPIPKPDRGAFDLSHEKKLSCAIGELVPFTWWECVPGDSFQIRTELLVKFAPLLRPLLHRFDVYTHFFKVPYRLLMNQDGNVAGWKDFITGDPNSWFATESLPYITIDNADKDHFGAGTLSDYLGLPVIDSGTTVTQDVDINCMPHLAYHLIYDEYYRDENLQTRRTGTSAGAASAIDLVGGDRSAEINSICPLVLLQRNLEKDIFRGALPTAYTGSSSDIELDLDIYGTGTNNIKVTRDNGTSYAAAGDIQASGSTYTLYDATGTATADRLQFQTAQQGLEAVLEIQELRRALAITKWLEAERRGGTRYNEMLTGIWGIEPQDAELQYPEYLGGGKQAVQVETVVNHGQVLDSVDATVDPQGYESGRAVAAGSSNTINTYCREHCIIMGILSVLPRTAYGGAQIEKFWRKIDTREEFFVPQLQNIGDQAVLQSEVAYDATGSDMDDVFGYQPPWYEYKFKNSTVHADFLDTYADFHCAQIGDTSGAGPSLNSAFILCNPANAEYTRIFATSSGDNLYVELYNDVRAIRPMQVFDVPR